MYNNMFKIYRERRGLTQEGLSDISGVDVRSIQKIEYQERIPSVHTISKLIKALDISDEDILNYVKNPPKKLRKYSPKKKEP